MNKPYYTVAAFVVASTPTFW